MSDVTLLGVFLAILYAFIIIGLSVRVIMRRLPPGVSLAWLILIFLLPLVGGFVYLLIGERRIGRRRAERASMLLARYQEELSSLHASRVEWAQLDPEGAPIHRLAEATLGTPAMVGNKLELQEGAQSTLQSIIKDVDRAEHICHMEFYIWDEGGIADEVAEALIRAAKRGVTCRVLVDAVGSSRFLKFRSAGRLRENGVALVAALPIGLRRLAFARPDLRLHRKIVVIDDLCAYTGSLNLVDPRYFKKGAGVGEWVDAMVRVEGPAVQALEAQFSWDWEVETGEATGALANVHLAGLLPKGPTPVQVVPSGPGITRDAIHQLLLTSIYAARRELIVTTPYFIPDHAVLMAFKSAPRRGVKTTMIVPERLDSRLTQYASQSYYDSLLAAGVNICRFEGGLLHTKSVTVDGKFSIFGTVNLDVRSFWLDFEVTLLVYDADFTTRLRKLQMKYLEESNGIDLETWLARSASVRLVENASQLFAPLL
jgi:cardiolipin synthase